VPGGSTGRRTLPAFGASQPQLVLPIFALPSRSPAASPVTCCGAVTSLLAAAADVPDLACCLRCWQVFAGPRSLPQTKMVPLGRIILSRQGLQNGVDEVKCPSAVALLY